jgi:hypothetical protein
LVSAEERDGIFAWGMEIAHPGGSAAVVYRWDPHTRSSTHGIHDTAEGARALYSRGAGVSLVLEWEEVAYVSAQQPLWKSN